MFALLYRLVFDASTLFRKESSQGFANRKEQHHIKRQQRETRNHYKCIAYMSDKHEVHYSSALDWARAQQVGGYKGKAETKMASEATDIESKQTRCERHTGTVYFQLSL